MAKNYSKNVLHEVGESVSKDFEYRSDNNKNFLSVKEIIEINKELNF